MSKFTTPQQIILEALSRGIPARIACQQAAITMSELREMVKHLPQFAKAHSEAMADGNIKWLERLEGMADDNFNAAKMLARSFDKDTWGEDGKLTIDFAEMSEEQLDKLCDGDVKALDES